MFIIIAIKFDLLSDYLYVVDHPHHFRKAILRTPGRSMVDGLSNAGLGKPDYELALEQHAAYDAVLREIGLDTTVLPAAEEFPDACFVEDVALVTPSFAVISHPGAASRTREIDLIESIINTRFDSVHRISQGYLEGGDVMLVGKHFYVGLSSRTDEEGFQQFNQFVDSEGYSASLVSMGDLLHLKTGMSYLEHNNLLIQADCPAGFQFDGFNHVEVIAKESYAANSLWINDHILVPSGNPGVVDSMEELDYQVIELQMSEFEKLDGGLSCLSLRY